MTATASANSSPQSFRKPQVPVSAALENIYHPLVQTLAKQNHLSFYAVRQPRKILLFKLIIKTTKQYTTSNSSFLFQYLVL